MVVDLEDDHGRLERGEQVLVASALLVQHAVIDSNMAPSPVLRASASRHTLCSAERADQAELAGPALRPAVVPALVTVGQQAHTLGDPEAGPAPLLTDGAPRSPEDGALNLLGDHLRVKRLCGQRVGPGHIVHAWPTCEPSVVGAHHRVQRQSGRRIRRVAGQLPALAPTSVDHLHQPTQVIEARAVKSGPEVDQSEELLWN